jgi:hypothetical protein
MAETAITIQSVTAPFAAVTAGSADFTFAAGDVANGNSFVCTGKEVLLAYNSDGANPYYVTISSVDDEKGRSEDITQYSLAAGDYAVFGVGLTNSKGWKDTGGLINIAVENVAVQVAVLRIP